MENQTRIITVTTLHDPESRMIPKIQQVLSDVIRICGPIIVVCTKETTEDCADLITKKGCIVIHNHGQGYVQNYRLAVKKALDTAHHEEKFFYCDFDRLLHWYITFPDELKALLSREVQTDFLLIGRTSRAFATHPITQTATESIINQIGSKILNFTQTRDVIVASWICDQTLAKKLLQLNTITKTGFYVFWPIMMWLWAKDGEYLETEGQEWETADRYFSEIQEIGYSKWLEKWQSPEEWQKRTTILKDCLEELNTIIDVKLKN